MTKKTWKGFGEGMRDPGDPEPEEQKFPGWDPNQTHSGHWPEDGPLLPSIGERRASAELSSGKVLPGLPKGILVDQGALQGMKEAITATALQGAMARRNFKLTRNMEVARDILHDQMIILEFLPNTRRNRG